MMTGAAASYDLVCAGLPPQRLEAKDATPFLDARRDLESWCYVEQLFDYVTQNQLELERDTARVSHARMMGIETDHHDEMHLLMRRLCNLLSSVRMYMDQAPHLIDEISVSGRFTVDDFHRVRREVYDGSVGFQLMDALRNVAQHVDFPADILNVHGQREYSQEVPKAVHVTSLVLTGDSLREARKKVKKRVVDSVIKHFGERIDLMLGCREGYSGLSRIHTYMRRGLHKKLSASLVLLDRTQESFRERMAFPDEFSGLSLRGSDGLEQLWFPRVIFMGKRWLRLAETNRGNAFTHEQVVATELPRKRPG